MDPLTQRISEYYVKMELWQITLDLTLIGDAHYQLQSTAR